jgi:hypothetical protein
MQNNPYVSPKDGGKKYGKTVHKKKHQVGKREERESIKDKKHPPTRECD